MKLFRRYIGIDYSGARTPTCRLKALQVYMASSGTEPEKITTPAGHGWNWTRKEIANWCVAELAAGEPIIIGIDHGFSFPVSYMQRYGLRTWDAFLRDFHIHWPTDEDDTYIDFIRANNPRTGNAKDLRICEKWTATAKSVFLFDVQGAVAKASHAGIPWLQYIRDKPHLKGRLHFWPFDGFEIPPKKSVIVEVYPSLFRRRHPRDSRTVDEHDAWSIAMWLMAMDQRGVLADYFNPPLLLPERRTAKIEGWILGVY